MSVLTSYTLVGVKYYNTVIPCSGGNISFEISEVAAGAGQGIFNTAAAIKAVGGKISITTPCIAVAYNALGEYSRIYSTPSETKRQLVLYFAKRKLGGVYDSTGHVRVTCNQGVIVWTGLSASHNEVAQMTYEATLISDGSGGDPMTIDTGALPTDVAVARIYTSGQVLIDGALYDVAQMSFDPGWNVIREGAGGLPWFTGAYINRCQPSASFTTQEEAMIDTLTEIGSYQAASTLFFRAFDGEVADGRALPATEVHISIALAQSIIMPGSMSGAWTDTSSIPVRIVPFSDPDTPLVAPHVVDVTAKIEIPPIETPP